MGLSLSITHTVTTAAWPLFSRAHIRPATVADLNAYANRAGLSFQAQSHSQSQSPSPARSQFHWHSNPLETLVWAAKNEQQRQQVLVRLTVDAIKILWPHKLLRVRSCRRRGGVAGGYSEGQITIQQITFNRTRKRSKVPWKW